MQADDYVPLYFTYALLEFFSITYANVKSCADTARCRHFFALK